MLAYYNENLSFRSATKGGGKENLDNTRKKGSFENIPKTHSKWSVT